MATDQCISPLPADLDRQAFGHWLSGFVDGEGCFILGMAASGYKWRKYEMPTASFCLQVRADDLPVLRQIQSFLQCGTLTFCNAPSLKLRKSKPQWLYRIRRRADQVGTLIPHFLAHPLRAKKSRDFLLWKQGVELIAAVTAHPRRLRTERKWGEEDLAHFRELYQAIRQCRHFTSGS